MIFGARLWRYALAGGATAALYVVLYVCLLALGVPQWIANGASFLLAVAFQYVAQAAFTFEAPLRDGTQIARFVAMIALGLTTSAAITGWIGPLQGLADWMSAAIVAVILPIQNFFIMSLWVFARTHGRKECPE